MHLSNTFQELEPTARTVIIVNPNAGKRHVMRHWPEVRALLDDTGIFFTPYFTEGKLHAVEITRQAIAGGARDIIVFGGDGTLHEAVNGIFTQQYVSPGELTLAMIPAGTGNDWGRMFRLPGDYKSIAEMIKARHIFLHDIGEVRFTEAGRMQTRYFINVAGIGFDAVVVKDANGRKERGMGGKSSYVWSLLRSLLTYSNTHAVIEADGEEIFSGALYSGNIGICRFSGGGMQQVPAALADDGLFDITVIRKLSRRKVVWNVRKLFDGSFVHLPQVSTHRAGMVRISSNEELLLEADGEVLGCAPMEFRILPGALKVLVPGDCCGH
jgi:YegS/Rv2252/BmrU family lipid kinase